MQKLVRLQAKHEEQVRAILDEHKVELAPSSWTLNDNWEDVGCQVITHYIEADCSIERRINLFRPQQPKRVEVWPDKQTAKEAAKFQAAERAKMEVLR